MAASNKPNPAPSKKSATSGGAAATKVPAKGAARKSTASNKPAATKARATKATTTPMKNTAATTPAPTKSTATKATAKKAPARSATATKATAATTAATTATKAAGTPTTAVKAAPRRVPKPPSPDTPSILSNYRPDRHEIPAARGTSKDGITYTKDFDVKFLKAQRDELLARRASELARATRLEDEATSLIEDGEMGDVQFDDEGGEGDTMVVQRDLDRVLSTQARQTIADIDAALTRIEVGTYGYSEVSGLPIPRERLEALPETTVLAAEKVSGIGVR
jgi:RNA polymerase-binding transcription factor DksA